MEKLKKLVYEAMVKPLSKEKLYCQIFYEVEAALSEEKNLLPCLELLDQLYPQSMDVSYLTASLLFRNELYQEAWQQLSVQCAIFLKRNVETGKNCSGKPEMKQSEFDPLKETKSDTVSAKLSGDSCCGRCKGIKCSADCISECKPNDRETLNMIVTFKKNPCMEECPKQPHGIKSKKRSQLSNSKDEHGNTSESNNSSSDNSCTEQKENLSSETVSKEIACLLSASPTFSRFKRKIRDPCFRTLQATVVNALVDRWHIPMLNDKKRNLAFKNALKNLIMELITQYRSKEISSSSSKFLQESGLNSTSVKSLQDDSKQVFESNIVLPEMSSSEFFDSKNTGEAAALGRLTDGCHSISGENEGPQGVLQSKSKMKRIRVLDIGAGSGLLSLYAALDPQVEVTGCDASAIMCEMAEEVVRLNALPVGLEKKTVLEDQGGLDALPTPSGEGLYTEELHHEQHVALMKECYNCAPVQAVKRSTMEDETLLNDEVCCRSEERLHQCGSVALDEPRMRGRSDGTSAAQNDCLTRLGGSRREFECNDEEKFPEGSSVMVSGVNSEIRQKYHFTSHANCRTKQKKSKPLSKSKKFRKLWQDIKILNMHSTSLQLSERADVVVSETLDAALLGEQCVPTLLDAWQRLLKPPTSQRGAPARDSLGPQRRVIPGRAEAYLSIVESLYICRYSKPLKREKDFSLLGPISITSVSDDEPYNTERLEHLPEGYKLLSSWQKVLDVDFNSVDDLMKFASGKVHKNFAVRCSTRGEVDAVVLGFKLYVDEQNVIDTRPGDNRCWETAVYPSALRRSVEASDILAFRLTASDVIRVVPIVEPKAISVLSEQMNGKCRCADSVCAHWTLIASYVELQDFEIDHILNSASSLGMRDACEMMDIGEKQCLRECKAVAQPHLELSAELQDPTQVLRENFFVLPPRSLRAYNSLTFMSAFRCAAQVIASKLQSCSGEVLVYDETPFPIAALELHKTLRNVTVVVEQESIQHLLASNEVKCITLETFMSTKSYSNTSAAGIASTAECNEHTYLDCELGRQNLCAEQRDRMHNRVFNAMFMWPISDLGILDEDFDTKVKFCHEQLATGGLMYPSSIDVYGACIASASLLSCTRVSDDNTCGVQVAATLQMVKTTHQLDVTLQSLPLEQLTDVAHMFTISQISGRAHASSRNSCCDPTCHKNSAASCTHIDINQKTDENSSTEQMSSKAFPNHDDSTSGVQTHTRDARPMGATQGQNTVDALSARDFHSRGLLAFNNDSLFEHTVRLPVRKTGEVAGVAHWFRLRGIFDMSCGSELEEREHEGLTTDESTEMTFVQQTRNCDKDNAHACSTKICCESDSVTNEVNTFSNFLTNVTSTESSHQIESSAGESRSSSTSFPVGSSQTENRPASPGVSGAPCLDNAAGSFSCGANVITVGEESPCNQACFMVDSTFEVEPQQALLLDCVYKNGCFWIEAYSDV